MIVSCPECGTAKSVESEEAERLAQQHNENLHDGDDVAVFGEEALELPGSSRGMDRKAARNYMEALEKERLREAVPEFSEEEKENIQAAVEALKEGSDGRA